MKALAFKEFGGPEKLALLDVPDPVAGPGEVLASEAVVEAAVDDRFGFERIEDARLGGVQSPVALYRVSRSARPLR